MLKDGFKRSSGSVFCCCCCVGDWIYCSNCDIGNDVSVEKEGDCGGN